MPWKIWVHFFKWNQNSKHLCFVFVCSQHANEDVERMLLGNKCDMEDKRVVPKAKGEQVRTLKMRLHRGISLKSPTWAQTFRHSREMFKPDFPRTSWKCWVQKTEIHWWTQGPVCRWRSLSCWHKNGEWRSVDAWSACVLSGTSAAFILVLDLLQSSPWFCSLSTDCEGARD